MWIDFLPFMRLLQFRALGEIIAAAAIAITFSVVLRALCFFFCLSHVAILMGVLIIKEVYENYIKSLWMHG